MQKNFDDIFDKVLNDDLIQPQQPKQAPTPTPKPIKETSNVNVPAKPLDLFICDNVVSKIMHKSQIGEIVLPEKYNVINEVQLAIHDMMNNDILNSCTPDSIEGALLEYAIQGLSISQRQAWFVGFGSKATMLRSYFGDVAVCKRTNLIKDCKANVIYDGDEIEVDYNDKQELEVVKHKTKFGNQDNEILGAYAYTENLDGTRTYCVMTMKEIRNNWALSKGKNKQTGEVKFQQQFPQEACKRTVIRRLIKMIFNTSVETNEHQKNLIASYNRTTQEEYIDADFSEQTTEEMFEKVSRNSNSYKIEDDM